MYDQLETEISFSELKNLVTECRKSGIKIAIIGGWATRFHVNQQYSHSFGKPYMGSRDIDVFFYKKDDEKFLSLIKNLGFTKDGFRFRWQKIYDRNRKCFISEEDSKKLTPFDIVYIFLDLFSDEHSTLINTWYDLAPLKSPHLATIDGYETIDLGTLIELKCVSMASRDKADKENKDACDLYSLLEYGSSKIEKTDNIIRAIEKISKRQDLIYSISQHVLLDPGKQTLVISSLQRKLKKLNDDGFIESK